MVRGAAKLKRESSRRRTIHASVRFIRAFYKTAQAPHATPRKLPATPRAMLSVQALSGFKVWGSTSRTWRDLDCLIAAKRHSQRLAAIWILQSSRSVVTGALPDAH